MWYSLFREKYQIPTIRLVHMCTIFISFLRLFIAQNFMFNNEYNNIMLLCVCVCVCLCALHSI